MARYGSDEWTRIYIDRWEDLYQTASKRNVQLVIVGLPIMKSNRFDTKLQAVSSEVFSWANQNDIPVIQIRNLTTNEAGAYQQYLTHRKQTIEVSIERWCPPQLPGFKNHQQTHLWST